MESVEYAIETSARVTNDSISPKSTSWDEYRVEITIENTQNLVSRHRDKNV